MTSAPLDSPNDSPRTCSTMLPSSSDDGQMHTGTREHHVDAATDATATATRNNRADYMRPNSPWCVGEMEETAVELCLAEGLDGDDSKEAHSSRVADSAGHEIISTGVCADVSGPEHRLAKDTDSTTGQLQESLVNRSSDGTFLLRRSTLYASLSSSSGSLDPPVLDPPPKALSSLLASLEPDIRPSTAPPVPCIPDVRTQLTTSSKAPLNASDEVSQPNISDYPDVQSPKPALDAIQERLQSPPEAHSKGDWPNSGSCANAGEGMMTHAGSSLPAEHTAITSFLHEQGAQTEPVTGTAEELNSVFGDSTTSASPVAEDAACSNALPDDTELGSTRMVTCPGLPPTNSLAGVTDTGISTSDSALREVDELALEGSPERGSPVARVLFEESTPQLYLSEIDPTDDCLVGAPDAGYSLGAPNLVLQPTLVTRTAPDDDPHATVPGNPQGPTDSPSLTDPPTKRIVSHVPPSYTPAVDSILPAHKLTEPSAAPRLEVDSILEPPVIAAELVAASTLEALMFGDNLPLSSLPASQPPDTPCAAPQRLRSPCDDIFVDIADATQAPSSACSSPADVNMIIKVNLDTPFASENLAPVAYGSLLDEICTEVREGSEGDHPGGDETTTNSDVYAEHPFDLPPSSPPPSSSPPHIFSSSPPRDLGSPPSSSPPLPVIEERSPRGFGGDKLVFATKVRTESVAHYDAPPHSPSVSSLAPSKPGFEDEERPTKRTKVEALPDPPQPKRLTQATVAKQRKKLAAPFRSPVIKGPLVQGGLHAVYATGRAFTPPPRKARAEDVVDSPATAAMEFKPDPTAANKDRTANAAKQFKSPLVLNNPAATPSSSASSTPFSTVTAAPTIRSLQGKLQTLKQAIRIKNSGSGDAEDDLERLVAKWTAAGREVAWAVWDYVKDLDPGTSSVGEKTGSGFANGDEFWGPKAGEKRGFDPGWGYDGEPAAKKLKLGDESEDSKMSQDGDDEQPAVQHTLGTMLRHLSIDPATLGWDEEEGDFVDV